MTDEELSAIKARAVAATLGGRGGGWTYLADLDEDDIKEGYGIVGPQYPGSTIDILCTVTSRVADVEFIAHARNDIPALIVEVERLRKQEFLRYDNERMRRIQNCQHETYNVVGGKDWKCRKCDV